MSVRKLMMATAASMVALIAATASGAETLKIGIIAPLTGPGAPWGMAVEVGAEILADRYNADGGMDVGGKKYLVDIIAYDDKYKAPDALAAYQRLVYQDGVKHVVIASGISTMALKQFVIDDGIIGMTAGYVADAISADAPHMYRMWGIPADYFPPLYKWLAENTTERRVVVLNPDDESAREAAGMAALALESHGYEVLLNDTYERATKDFLPLMTRVIGVEPELIDLGTTAPAVASLLINQAREMGYKGRFFIPGSSSWREILAGSGPVYAEGVLNMVYADPENPAYAAFAAEYQKRVGQEPNESLAPYSDGVNVLLHAIAASGSVDDPAAFDAGFRKALPMPSLQGETLTIAGGMKHGIDNQVLATRLIGEVRDGKLVIVGKIQ